MANKMTIDRRVCSSGSRAGAAMHDDGAPQARAAAPADWRRASRNSSARERPPPWRAARAYLKRAPRAHYRFECARLAHFCTNRHRPYRPAAWRGPANKCPPLDSPLNVALSNRARRPLGFCGQDCAAKIAVCLSANGGGCCFSLLACGPLFNEIAMQISLRSLGAHENLQPTDWLTREAGAKIVSKLQAAAASGQAKQS